jgi:membrane protease YdiL (CAAX protease family)
LAAVALARDEMDLLMDSETRMQWIFGLTASRFGLLVLLLPSQLAFAVVAAGAALFSRDPWRERLGLRAGRLPVWTWLLFLAGTPMINIVSSQFISLLADEPSEQLQMLEQLFQFRSFSALLTLLLLVGLVPGVVEEVLFRGYLQRRLLTRMHPIVAIGICSVFFAAAHMDPMHAVGVLPLGIWLGVIAWRADSIWPAVCGHVGNNSFSIVMAGVMGTEADVEQIGLVAVLVLGITLLSFVGAITMLALLGGRQVAALHDPNGV